MRIILVLLSIYICLLSLQSAVVDVLFDDSVPKQIKCSSACSRAQMTKPGNCGAKFPSKNCLKGLCNPFEQCLWFGELTLVLLQILPGMSLEYVPDRNSVNPASSYLSDCFHPPEEILKIL